MSTIIQGIASSGINGCISHTSCISEMKTRHVEILSDMRVTKSVVERKQDIPDKGLVANSEGNMIHCSAEATVTHNFLRLKEGSIYSVKNFAVKPNKEEYRILKNDAYMLESDGSTTIRKALVKADGFVRYPLELQDFDDIESSYNKYLIGELLLKLPSNDQRSGGQTFKIMLENLTSNIANHKRGQSIKVTLRGSLGDVLIEKKTKQTGVCQVILTATCPKKYNNKVYLSSTSFTVIYDDDAILAIKALKKANSIVDQQTYGTSVDLSQPRAGTLKNLLMWARNRKNDVYCFLSNLFWIYHCSITPNLQSLSLQSITFHCKVTIDGIRTRKGWNFPSCGSDTCTGLKLTCQTTLLRLLLLCSMKPSSEDHLSLPPALSNLIGTAHVMEIKSHTYYKMDIEDSESEDSGDSANGTWKKGAVEPSAKKSKNCCGSGRVGVKGTNATDAAYEKGRGYTHIPFCLDD
ncbi:hypothetical protein Tco_0815860 [Tanacetum coccineum]